MSSLSTARPGRPSLQIAPVARVVEPIVFAVAGGEETGPEATELHRCVADVRLEVFVGEQAVPLVQEIDARDFEASTIHVLARGGDGAPLGAGRLLLEPDHPGRVHLGRLAVRRVARGTGLGARLVAAIEAVAVGRAAVGGAGRSAVPSVTVFLSAQERAMGFYERCGYRTVPGERYLDAGIWHRDMARTVTGLGTAEEGR